MEQLDVFISVKPKPKQPSKVSSAVPLHVPEYMCVVPLHVLPEYMCVVPLHILPEYMCVVPLHVLPEYMCVVPLHVLHACV